MKSSANADLKMVSKSSVIIENEVLIKRVFERLLNTIAHLFPTSGDTFVTCVADRGPARAAGLLTEPFGIRDANVIEEATYASLCLDVFSHAVDDVTDDPNSDRVLLVHIGSLLLAEAAGTYARLVANHARFWSYWHHYLKRSSEAELLLQKNGDIAVTNVALLGQKSSLINMSAVAYACLTNRYELLDPINRGLMAAAIGIQLIDDLIDWQQDSRDGTSTYPIALAQQRSATSLHEVFNSGPLFLEVLELATNNLLEGERAFKAIGAFSMGEFLSLLINRITDANMRGLFSPTAAIEISRADRLRWIVGPRLGH